MKKTICTIFIVVAAVYYCFAQDPLGVDKRQQDEIDLLKKEIAALKNEISTLKTTLRGEVEQAKKNQNSNIASNKRTLEERVQQVETSVNQKIGSLEQSVAASILSAKKETGNALEKLNNVLPIGSIIAYHLDITTIPSNWVLCDGRKITDANSIYNGYNVPNLVGYFIRGKASDESVGQKGGRDDIPSHTHSIPSHKHEVGDHTHNFTTENSSISHSGYCDYGVACRSSEGAGVTQYLLFSNSPSGFRNQTSHYHTGRTGNASSGYTQTGGAGTTGSGGGGSNVPEYKAFNYIIKIK